MCLPELVSGYFTQAARQIPLKETYVQASNLEKKKNHTRNKPSKLYQREAGTEEPLKSCGAFVMDRKARTTW